MPAAVTPCLRGAACPRAACLLGIETWSCSTPRSPWPRWAWSSCSQVSLLGCLVDLCLAMSDLAESCLLQTLQQSW